MGWDGFDLVLGGRGWGEMGVACFRAWGGMGEGGRGGKGGKGGERGRREGVNASEGDLKSMKEGKHD